MTIREYNECLNEHADGLFRFIVKNGKMVMQNIKAELRKTWV